MHPVLLRWGRVTLHAYGVLLAIAVFAAARLAARRAPRVGATASQVMDVCLWGVLGGLLGARLVYVVQHWPFYAATPWEIVRLDHGGLVFYGGLLGGLAAALVVVRRVGLPGWRTLDLLVPSVVLAQGIGRLGCFLNGCCYGTPTTRPWAVRFPGESVARHPTQLYESAALLVLAGALLWCARQPLRLKPGVLTGWYLVSYGVWRFGVEFVRGDNAPVAGALTFSQVVSIPLVLLGVWLLWRRRGRAPATRSL